MPIKIDEGVGVMKSKQLLIVIAVTILTVICITVLRAVPPLNGIFGSLEAKWGQPVIVGLQAGIGAGAGVLVSRLYRNKRGSD